MTKERMAVLFDEWLRRFIEDPKKFSTEWKAIQEAKTYGASCAAFIEKLDAEMPA